MSDVPAGKAAKDALAALKTDKELARELNDEQRAQSAYWTMLARSMRLELQQRQARLPGALEQFATAFSGTSYADRALAEAHTISTGVLTAQ
jgi:hypothetical protein